MACILQITAAGRHGRWPPPHLPFPSTYGRPPPQPDHKSRHRRLYIYCQLGRRFLPVPSRLVSLILSSVGFLACVQLVRIEMWRRAAGR